jgi:Septum formation/Protein of unknown function (DUF2510)
MNASAPGWNPDPTGRHEYRYWDGTTWTDDVSDNGITSVDPVTAGGPGAAPTAPYEPTRAYGTPPGGQAPPAGPGTWGYGPQGSPSAPGGPGGPAGYQPMYGSGPLPPAQPPRSGPPTAVIVGIVVLVLAVIAGVVFALTSGDDDGGDDTTTDDTEDTSSETTADTSSDTTAETSTDTTAGSETTDVFAIGVGDCLTDETSTEGEVSEVPTVPCDQPHTYEVYHSYIIDSDEMPDSTEMDSIVQEQCLAAFETFIGRPYEQSIYVFQSLTPTQESWDAGDRELLCLVFNPSGETTGTLQGIDQ